VRPIVETRITQHTLWQALTGQTPPLSLTPQPIIKAVLDSRDVSADDLFIALAGRYADGHEYIEAALENQAAVIICEERGRAAALQHNATIIDCTEERGTATHDWTSVTAKQPLVYLVNDSEKALQTVGAFQRLHRHRSDLR